MIDPHVQQPSLRVRPGPDVSNARGDIFGGWMMAQIDIAGSVAAGRAANGMTATKAVKDLVFVKPVFTYDLVSFYAEVQAVGTTSVTVRVEAYAQRTNGLARPEEEMVKVAEATLTFVAIDGPGRKRTIQR